MINIDTVLCQLHFASYQSHKNNFFQFLTFKHLEFVNGREAFLPDQVSNLWADLTLLSGYHAVNRGMNKSYYWWCLDPVFLFDACCENTFQRYPDLSINTVHYLGEKCVCLNFQVLQIVKTRKTFTERSISLVVHWWQLTVYYSSWSLSFMLFIDTEVADGIEIPESVSV